MKTYSILGVKTWRVLVKYMEQGWYSYIEYVGALVCARNHISYYLANSINISVNHGNQDLKPSL